MKVNVMKKGDNVLSVTNEFIAIRRKNGEVDILPIILDGNLFRVDLENITTIGYGDNTIVVENDNGSKIISF